MADTLLDSERDRSVFATRETSLHEHGSHDVKPVNAGLIYLVENDAHVLQAISCLLRKADYEVRAFRSPVDFLEHHDFRAAGCAVLGLAMAGMNGLELDREMHARGHGRPVVFIAGREDLSLSVEAMKAGAVDVLTKPVFEQSLFAAVRSALECDHIARRARNEIEAVIQRVSRLTPREREVMDCVVMGCVNKQIAAAMRISEKTVKVHRSRVMTKMAVRSLPELVRLSDQMLAREPLGYSCIRIQIRPRSSDYRIPIN
jgi:FixJ family two-component response regulator